MICLISGLIRQPPSTNSADSHSSSSGCVGGCPWKPKLSGVGTSPRPKEMLPDAIGHHAREARWRAIRAASANALAPDVGRWFRPLAE